MLPARKNVWERIPYPSAILGLPWALLLIIVNVCINVASMELMQIMATEYKFNQPALIIYVHHSMGTVCLPFGLLLRGDRSSRGGPRDAQGDRNDPGPLHLVRGSALCPVKVQRALDAGDLFLLLLGRRGGRGAESCAVSAGCAPHAHPHTVLRTFPMSACPPPNRPQPAPAVDFRPLGSPLVGCNMGGPGGPRLGSSAVRSRIRDSL